MIEFWLTFNNRKEQIQFPVNPGEISISNASTNETITVQKLGEISILNDPAQKVFSFSSFFPYNPGAYLCVSANKLKKPRHYSDLIEKWKKQKSPARLIITSSGRNELSSVDINIPVSIESFNVREAAGDTGTLLFDITLREFRFTKITQIKKVVTSTVPVVTANNRPNEQSPVRTYKVKLNDCLWKISKKYYGKGALYPKIATANNIKAPYTIYVDQVLKIP